MVPPVAGSCSVGSDDKTHTLAEFAYREGEQFCRTGFGNRAFGQGHSANTEVQYQRYENRGPRPLLREMLETDFDSDHQRMFRANRSLRDVEPEVNLYLRTLSGVY